MFRRIPDQILLAFTLCGWTGAQTPLPEKLILTYSAFDELLKIDPAMAGMRAERWCRTFPADALIGRAKLLDVDDFQKKATYSGPTSTGCKK